MEPVRAKPKLHVFVCHNQRRADDPLGPGCGERGARVYARLKEEVARRGLVVDVWVTRTQCLGICPKLGCTVARWGEGGGEILRDVAESDAPALLSAILPTG